MLDVAHVPDAGPQILVLDALEDPNDDGNTSDSILTNTLVMFTSDNGGLHKFAGLPTGYNTTGELLGYKGSPYEGGHRVPFVAMWPGTIATNSVSDQLIATHDWVGVMYGLAGAAMNPTQAMDCVNILPILTGERPESLPLRGFLMTQGYNTNPRYVMRMGDYVLLMDSTNKVPLELYNLADDLLQANNLIGDPDEQERIDAMEALYKQYDEQNDPRSTQF